MAEKWGGGEFNRPQPLFPTGKLLNFLRKKTLLGVCFIQGATAKDSLPPIHTAFFLLHALGRSILLGASSKEESGPRALVGTACCKEQMPRRSFPCCCHSLFSAGCTREKAPFQCAHSHAKAGANSERCKNPISLPSNCPLLPSSLPIHSLANLTLSATAIHFTTALPRLVATGHHCWLILPPYQHQWYHG